MRGNDPIWSKFSHHASTGDQSEVPAIVKLINYLESCPSKIIRPLAEAEKPLPLAQEAVALVMVGDAQPYEEQERAVALLKILALGNREIEEGWHRSPNEVFADLDKGD